MRPFCLSWPIVALIAAGGAFAAQQPPPQFRAGITLVPLDVRVVDREGNPVKDLKASEFTILEDGLRQELRHFSTADLEAAASAPPSTAEGAPDVPTRRVFLLVLGRGRLQVPAKGADAAVEFVKRHVLPNDYVAVLAWNRATSFTTDHATTIAVLDRFKRSHERIEQDMQQHFRGLAAVYAGPEIPAPIQARIDDVFAESGSTVASGVVAQSTSGALEARSLRENMMTNELRALFPDSTFITPVGEDAEAVRNRLPVGMELSFDQFVGIERQSAQDITNLYAGISYMRHLVGEKHLVFITESGTYMPSADDDRGLATTAADARVAMHVMHTGGTVVTGGGGFTQTSNRVARMTGGSFSSTSMGSRFMDRLDRATRFQYVLGYSPSNPTFDDRFRRVEVRVSRPNVQVQYRSGYFARRTPIGLTPALVLAQGRIAAGLMASREIKDLTISATATTARDMRAASFVDVAIIVGAPRVTLTPTADPHLTRVTLEVAMFVADSRNQIVGQSWRTVTAHMGADALRRFRTHGMRLTGRVDVTTPGHAIKVVVYDPGADLMGTVTGRIESR